jgi:CMP-N-acetylneuraminic acid synthetase
VINYVIPAREGSKGWRGKNRKLFPATYKLVKTNGINPIVVTDDADIADQCDRSEVYYRTMDDLSSTRDVLMDCAAFKNMHQFDTIVMLYCTYPGRRWRHIEEALEFFTRHHAKSLLCRKDVKTNPFLCMYDFGLHGQQVIQHELYRRQDYMRVFEISHYIAILGVDELPHLNRNLYNEDTVFLPVGDVSDIDSEEDYERFLSLHVDD